LHASPAVCELNHRRLDPPLLPHNPVIATIKSWKSETQHVPSGNAHVVFCSVSFADYSAVAFLPVIMIGAVVLGICGVCQYKRWKHEKKQIAHLSEFYEVFEGSSFRYGKMLVPEHPDIDEVSTELCVFFFHGMIHRKVTFLGEATIKLIPLVKILETNQLDFTYCM
uniref:PIG-H domain-containing protein n=1 Tax=Heligmosomoides polygyrus TaxID=6339 RepID=A0A183FBR2_HELPZ